MNFSLSISDQAFEKKPENYSQITFERKELTMPSFVDILRTGHMFCAVMDDSNFSNKGYQTSQHFLYTNVVSIDIDDCDCSMRDYMKTLKDEPSVAYETFSNLEEGKGYRFRFLYIFEESFDAGAYKQLYDAICERNGIDLFNDHAAHSPYQKIWGTNGMKRQIIPIGTIYHLKNFDISPKMSVEVKKTQRKETSTHVKSQFEDKVFEHAWKNASDLDILKNMVKYKTHEATQIDWKDGELWRDLEGTHYYEIKRRWGHMLLNIGGREKSIPVIKRLKNGEHRRKMIFLSLVRRRLINPSIRFEHLCYAALYEVHFFCDNTDESDVITRNQLMGIADGALNVDLKRYEEKLHSQKHFKVNKTEAEKQDMTARQAVAMAIRKRWTDKKNEEYGELSKRYDMNKSTRENAQSLGITQHKALNLRKWMIDNCPDLTRSNYIRKKHTGNNTIERVSGALVGALQNDDYSELSKRYDMNKSERENAKTLGITKTKAHNLKKWILSHSEDAGEQESTNDVEMQENAPEVANMTSCGYNINESDGIFIAREESPSFQTYKIA